MLLQCRLHELGLEPTKFCTQFGSGAEEMQAVFIFKNLDKNGNAIACIIFIKDETMNDPAQ